MSQGSTPPMAYLAWAFFESDAPDTAQTAGVANEGAQVDAASPDCVVWANRGGGKTLLGAVATLLDLLFKPGVQVRILGGSLEQSARMYEHLVALCQRPGVRGLLAGEPTRRGVGLINGSRAAILAQSQRSVRGVRVHKLRCDEVEAFDPQVWEAAQLVTRSGRCGNTPVRGSVEALSTMHRVGGIMSKLVADCDSKTAYLQDVPHSNDFGLTTKKPRLFRWTYLDVMERCPQERPCEPCVLWAECGGRAKHAAGFMRIDDLIAQWRRTSRDTWQAEMLCLRPRRSDSVYPGFDPDRHVRVIAWPEAEAGANERPASVEAEVRESVMWVGGMDFGLRSPLVMLWAVVRGRGESAQVHVVDEYAQRGRTLEQHLAQIQAQAEARGHGPLAWLGVDVAGRARNSHSGLSDIDMLRRHGYRVRSIRSAVAQGVQRIRRRLDHGTLTISPRCAELIEAMQRYHFNADQPHQDEPVKDGPDHWCDALRYLIINLELGSGSIQVRRYVEV